MAWEKVAMNEGFSKMMQSIADNERGHAIGSSIVFNRILFALLMITLFANCKGSEVLAPTPSALDLDSTAPTCPGLAAVSLSSGPALALTWGAASDSVSASSAITYLIFMKTGSGSYDLASPTKIVTGQTSGVINTGISVGQTYTLWVSCKDEAGNVTPTTPTNEKSISVSDVTAPSQITDLAASNPTYTSILLTWSPSDDGTSGTTASAMRYKVYGSTTAGVATTGTPLTTITGTTSYLHTNLNPNETWYYKVTALDSSSNVSSNSNEASSSTTNDTTPPTFASTSGGLASGTVTTTDIPLTWSAASDNVTATAALTYKLYRCSGSISCDPYAGTLVTTTAAGVTSYTNTSLTPSMIYVYGVRAVDYRGNVSTNTGTFVSSTQYSNSGARYIIPTLTEPAIEQGSGVAIANVVGAASGASAFPDLIVGAPYGSDPNSAYRQNGCVYIYAGTAVGTFATLPTQAICSPAPTGDGAAVNYKFGYSLIATDLDGDGIKDLVISYPNNNIVYFYITQNSSGTLSVPTSPNANISVTAGTGNSYFGVGLCSGNLDGVGADDVVIVSAGDNSSPGKNGYANVYLNTSSGGSFVVPGAPYSQISPQASIVAGGWTVTAGPGTEQVVRSCSIGNFDSSAPANTQIVLGSGLTGIAANNDGVVSFYDVTIAASPTINYVNFVSGLTTTGLASTLWGDAVAGVQLNATATSSVKSLAVGAPQDTTAGALAGAVYMYSVAKVTGSYVLTYLGRTWNGGRDLNNNQFGQSIAAASIWGQTDGSQDMVVGSWFDDQSSVQGAVLNMGDVYTYRNTNNQISTSISQMGFDPSSKSASSHQEFGSAICSGDVNNDGFTDVIIGSPRQDYDSTAGIATTVDIGAVYIYNGTATGEIDFAHPSQIIYGPGDQANGLFGASCVVMDYNGDGKKDLVVGSPGRTVSGNAGRGSVFIYFGATSTALPTTSSSNIDGPYAQANANFGRALAVGDWDGNGYADLAIGAPGVNNTTPAQNGVGRVLVYWGVSTGIQTVASPTATQPIELAPQHGVAGAASSPASLTPKVIGSTQHCGAPNLYAGGDRTITSANWNFGYSLASFPTRAKASTGNVLGYDLVICAPGTNMLLGDISGAAPALAAIGVCYIYEGSIAKRGDGTSVAGDISTCASNEVRYDHATTASFPASEFFGAAITSGKWSGRANTNDLVICARQGRDLDNALSNVGGCLAYYGSADGSGNQSGGFQQVTAYHSYQAGARFTPVASKYYYNPVSLSETSPANETSQFGGAVHLLDVNNNGTVDLLIGEYQSDNRVAVDGTSGPATLGKNSGRVYLLRGGWPQ